MSRPGAQSLQAQRAKVGCSDHAFPPSLQDTLGASSRSEAQVTVALTCLCSQEGSPGDNELGFRRPVLAWESLPAAVSHGSGFGHHRSNRGLRFVKTQIMTSLKYELPLLLTPSKNRSLYQNAGIRHTVELPGREVLTDHQRFRRTSKGAGLPEGGAAVPWPPHLSLGFNSLPPKMPYILSIIMWKYQLFIYFKQTSPGFSKRVA